MPTPVRAPFLELSPTIFVSIIEGKWLLQHTTPSWRLLNPVEGFQRIVREERARDIALAVLAEHRPFPNAIVLATDRTSFPHEDGSLLLPEDSKFLVVDGQHRLWAQSFSGYNAKYTCMIHLGLTEVDMAKLFLEINNNQKRVPPSLRWDLVRLIRPDDDPLALSTAEIIYELTTDETSALYQRVDLTGEQGQITLKQASLAPEIKAVLEDSELFLGVEELDKQLSIFRDYFTAIRLVDPDTWDSGNSAFEQNRVMRALIRVLPKIMRATKIAPARLKPEDYLPYLSRIEPTALTSENIREIQGSAGIIAIFKTIAQQIFGEASEPV